MSISDNYSPLVQQGDGSTTEYSDNWNVLSGSFLVVELETISTGVRVPQTEGANYTLLFDDDGFVVTFLTAPTNLVNVVISRQVTLDQTDPYRTSKGFQGKVIENSFDKLTAIVQDQQDSLDRTPKFKVGSGVSNAVLPSPADQSILGWDGTDGAIGNLTTVGAINDAAGAATTAVGAAATSTTNASQTAADRAAIEAISDSLQWANTVTITSANSPVAAVMGTLYIADTTGGAIVVNLPAIASDGAIGVQKATADVNTVTVNRNGTDTIDNSADPIVIDLPSERQNFNADNDVAPKNWTSVSLGGLGAGNFIIDVFNQGVDFNAGDTTLTLSTAAGSANNVGLYYDDGRQFGFSLFGTTITTDAPIPSGVMVIYAVIGRAIEINVPADSSVSFAKLNSADIADQVEAEAGAVSNKLMTPERTKQAIDALVSTVTLGAAVDATSGTSIDFTSIPSGTTRVTVYFMGDVSVSGTSDIIVQLGDSGGIESSSYVSHANNLNASAQESEGGATGFFIADQASAGRGWTGKMSLELADSSTNTWIATGFVRRQDGGDIYGFTGEKSLSGELDRVRITTEGGSDTFDNGKINIQYQ